MIMLIQTDEPHQVYPRGIERQACLHKICFKMFQAHSQKNHDSMKVYSLSFIVFHDTSIGVNPMLSLPIQFKHPYRLIGL